MQTSHLFSHLFASVKLFQVMRQRFISALAMIVEKTSVGKFSLNLRFVVLKEKRTNGGTMHDSIVCCIYVGNGCVLIYKL